MVIFLDSAYRVNSDGESGVMIQDLFTQVLPLAIRAVISNVPLYVSNEALVREQTREKIPPGVKHVFTYRRYVFMVLKK